MNFSNSIPKEIRLEDKSQPLSRSCEGVEFGSHCFPMSLQFSSCFLEGRGGVGVGGKKLLKKIKGSSRPCLLQVQPHPLSMLPQRWVCVKGPQKGVAFGTSDAQEGGSGSHRDEPQAPPQEFPRGQERMTKWGSDTNPAHLAPEASQGRMPSHSIPGSQRPSDKQTSAGWWCSRASIQQLQDVTQCSHSQHLLPHPHPQFQHRPTRVLSYPNLPSGSRERTTPLQHRRLTPSHCHCGLRHRLPHHPTHTRGNGGQGF